MKAAQNRSRGGRCAERTVRASIYSVTIVHEPGRTTTLQATAAQLKQILRDHSATMQFAMVSTFVAGRLKHTQKILGDHFHKLQQKA